MKDNDSRKIAKKLIWRIPLYILGFAICLPNGIDDISTHIWYKRNVQNDENYYEQSSGSKWDGTWKFGDSWTITLNSRNDEAIVNGKSCFWQDGGNYAVIGVDRTSVLYMRKDGHLYSGDNKGNISVDFGFSLKKQ